MGKTAQDSVCQVGSESAYTHEACCVPRDFRDESEDYAQRVKRLAHWRFRACQLTFATSDSAMSRPALVLASSADTQQRRIVPALLDHHWFASVFSQRGCLPPGRRMWPTWLWLLCWPMERPFDGWAILV